MACCIDNRRGCHILKGKGELNGATRSGSSAEYMRDQMSLISSLQDRNYPFREGLISAEQWPMDLPFDLRRIRDSRAVCWTSQFAPAMVGGTFTMKLSLSCVRDEWENFLARLINGDQNRLRNLCLVETKPYWAARMSVKGWMAGASPPKFGHLGLVQCLVSGDLRWWGLVREHS